LLDTLGQSALQALSQRLAARAELGRLTREESADYLRHQLRVVGARPDAILDDEALDLLAGGCGGLPRVLNQAAHLAFALTFQAGAGRVDAEGVLEALARLGLDAGSSAEVPATAAVAEETAAAVDNAEPDADFGWPPGKFPLPPARLTYTPGRSG
jgi:hypothetical protein